MMTSIRRTNRATPISWVCATCRVPFGLTRVMAAMAVTSTARPSHANQFMTDDRIDAASTLGTPRKILSIEFVVG